MPYFRYAVGVVVAILGTVALSANSYLLGNGAIRWAHEHDVWERAALASGGAAVPWLLAIVPMLFAVVAVEAGWLSRQGQRGLILLLWAIFFFYNFMMGTSNIAKLREDTVATAQHNTDTLDAKKDRRRTLRTELDGIPPHRPAGSVEPLLQAQRGHPRWASTSECADITTRASRDFCDGYKQLESELAAARAADEITAKITELDEVIGMAPPTTDAKADPFVDTVSDNTGMAPKSVRVLLSMLTPFILEVMGAACWKLATILFGWSLRSTESASGGWQASPALLYSPDAINRAPVVSLAALTRGRQIAEWFWRECARPLAAGSMLEREWYESYCEICRRQNDVPLSVEGFRRIAARNKGLMIQDIDGEKHYQGYLPFIQKTEAMA